ncbi:hypothetical protein BD769DRAFT_1663072 [Suillus cothurnatus]|nr:hypothetical protein BD769DRAFT_1663072 [Suillus cothurnatus]
MTSYSLTAHPSVSSPPTSEAPNEAPNGSLILKSSPLSLRRTSPVTPIKHRVASSPIPMHEAHATYPILSSSQSSPIQRVISPVPSSSPVPVPSSSPVPGSSSPISKISSPISKSSSPMSIKRTSLQTVSVPPLNTTVSGESLTSATKHHTSKCGHQYSLLKDDGELEDNVHLPTKRLKMLFTSGTGCRRGCSASRAQIAVPSIPAFQPIPFQPNASTTIECLASTAAMIETDGDPTNTLLQHQSHQPRSQFPSQERLWPYSIPSLRATSCRTSKASTSIYNFNDDAERPERARRGSKLEIKLTDMRYYSELDQKNIKHARKLIILDMLLESGWKKTSELELVAAECISQASAASGHIMSSTEGINKLIFNGLSTIRGKLINEAERALSSLDIYPPDNSTLSDEERIIYIQQRVDLFLDDKNLSHYILHSYDPERGKILIYSAPPYLDLHEDFWFGRNLLFIDPQSRSLILQISWFMYALTGSAIFVCHPLCLGRSIVEDKERASFYNGKLLWDRGRSAPSNAGAHHDKCL